MLIESEAWERRDFIYSIGTLTVGKANLLAVLLCGAMGADKLLIRPELATDSIFIERWFRAITAGIELRFI